MQNPQDLSQQHLEGHSSTLPGGKSNNKNEERIAYIDNLLRSTYEH